MTKQKNNSLFLYTALIFIVAIIMIIISFFGQSNIQKNQPAQSQETLNSITEKASQLSEDNRLLMDENKTLLEENRNLRTEISELTEKNELSFEEKELLQKQIDNDNALFEIHSFMYEGYYKKARELLSEVVVEDLTPEQKKFYNILSKKLN